MNLDNLNKWLSLTANLGVIAGIIFVGMELQQNRVAMEGQTRSDIANMDSDQILRWAESEHIIMASSKINRGEDITDAATSVLRYALTAELRRWENIHYQFRQGLFSEEEFAGVIYTWEDRLQSLMYQDYLSRRDMKTFSIEFANLINELATGTN